MTALWSLVLAQAPHIGTQQLQDVVKGGARSVVLHKDDASTASFDISLFADELAYVTPRQTDLIAYRNDVLVYRGRIAPYVINLNEDSRRVTLTSVSYKGMLDRRIIHDLDCQTGLRTYTSQDVGSIVWDLIKLTQGVSGVNPSAFDPRGANATLGITPDTSGSFGFSGGGSGNTGITRTVTFRPGQTIRECIDSLAAGIASTATFTSPASTLPASGFEWDIGPDLKLRIWPLTLTAGGRGAATNFLLDYGGMVSGGSIQNDSAEFANLIRASAGTSVVAQTRGGGTSDGLWEKQIAVTLAAVGASAATTDQTQLNSAAVDAAAEFGATHPSYNLNITPGMWPVDPLQVPQLGDTAQVALPGLGADISDSVRINDISYAIGDDTEVVSVTLGRPPQFSLRGAALRTQAYETRLAQLERVLVGGSS